MGSLHSLGRVGSTGSDESKSVVEVSLSGIIFLALGEESRRQVGRGASHIRYALGK